MLLWLWLCVFRDDLVLTTHRRVRAKLNLSVCFDLPDAADGWSHKNRESYDNFIEDGLQMSQLFYYYYYVGTLSVQPMTSQDQN